MLKRITTLGVWGFPQTPDFPQTPPGSLQCSQARWEELAVPPQDPASPLKLWASSFGPRSQLRASNLLLNQSSSELCCTTDGIKWNVHLTLSVSHICLSCKPVCSDRHPTDIDIRPFRLHCANKVQTLSAFIFDFDLSLAIICIAPLPFRSKFVLNSAQVWTGQTAVVGSRRARLRRNAR